MRYLRLLCFLVILPGLFSAGAQGKEVPVPREWLSVSSASVNAKDAGLAIDGKTATAWNVSGGGWSQEIVIGLSQPAYVTALRYVHGNVGSYLTQYQVFVSEDGSTWHSASAPGTSAAGSLTNVSTHWEVKMAWPRMAKLVKLVYLNGAGNNVNTAEIGFVYETDPPLPGHFPPPPEQPPLPPPPLPVTPPPPPKPKEPPCEEGKIVPLPVKSARASAEDGAHVAKNTLDSRLGTRWSAQGKGQWIEFDMGGAHSFDRLGIAWFEGHVRQADFEVQASADGQNWKQVYKGKSSGTTVSMEVYPLSAAASARYVRIVGYGNSIGDWNSIAEARILAKQTCGCGGSSGLPGEPVPLPPISGTKYYVATNGSDSNPGTEAAPFRTVNKGARMLKPGDGLFIKEGTYAESLIDAIHGGESWQKPVVVTAYPGHKVTLRPSGGSYVLSLSGSDKQYIAVQGLILDAANVGGYAVIFHSDGKKTYPHHIRIADSEIMNGKKSGLMTFTGSNNHEFLNLNIHHNGKVGGHGIYLAANSNLVQGSDIHHNGGFGIQNYSSKHGATDNNIIRNNRIYNNGINQNNADNNPAGIVSSGVGNVIYNNLLWGNKRGIVLGYGDRVVDMEVFHNTVYSHPGAGIEVRSKSRNAIVRNNIAYRNGPNFANSGSGTVQSNNLFGPDPGFVNAAAQDFHLQSGSAAIDKGVTISEVPGDFAGGARPHGGAYDIGAYEHGSTPGTAGPGGFTGGGGAGGGGSGCVPPPAPPPTNCSGERWREDLVNHVVGFGKNTTGGKGGEICRVTNLNNSGAGSLRACAEATGPKWIVFDVSGTITLQSPISVKSNKTIDGRGQNVVITRNGLDLSAISNVIIHNLTMHTLPDGVGVHDGTTNIWIDHMTCHTAADECIDIGAYSVRNDPPSGITISWNRFDVGDREHMILVSDPSTPQDAATTITFHHNYYNTTYVRHPLARWATMHSFNNYYNKNEIGAQISSKGKFYSENDIFERGSSYPMVEPDPYASSGDELPAANVKVLNPYKINNPVLKELNPNGIFTPSSYYSYTAEPANDTLRQKIIAQAGRQNTLATGSCPQ